MGRGKVVMEKIDKEVTRQVSFARRKSGLFKKASELSILCDADVALILFSDRGKLHHFSSDDDITKTLERYRQYCYTSPDGNDSGLEPKSAYQEILKLRATYESLQRTHRHMQGEAIEPLNVKELQNLEKQLDKALSQARERKTKMMLDHLEELRKQEHDLNEMNLQLKSKALQYEEERRLHAIPPDQAPDVRTTPFRRNLHDPLSFI